MPIKKLDSTVLREHKGVSFTGVGTVFFCHDGAGKFVMTKRSQKCRDEKGRWEICGGGLKWGSSAEENIKREVFEEFGAEAKQISFMGYRDVFRELEDGTPTHWLMLDFVVLVDPKEVRINEPEMADDLGWFSLNTLPTPLHSQIETFVEKYRTQLKVALGA